MLIIKPVSLEQRMRSKRSPGLRKCVTSVTDCVLACIQGSADRASDAGGGASTSDAASAVAETVGAHAQGADVKETSAAGAQGASTTTRDATAPPTDATATPAGTAMGVAVELSDASAAAFYLKIGLQSMAGGNVHAAYDRYAKKEKYVQYIRYSHMQCFVSLHS